MIVQEVRIGEKIIGFVAADPARQGPHRQEEVGVFNWREAIDRAIRGAAKSTKNMPLLIDKMRRLTTIAAVCEYVEKDIKPESSRPLPVCPKGHTATLTLNGKPMEWIEVSRTELGR